MEILKMIDLLEDKVEQSKSIPLLNRALIDKEEILAAIEEIRLNIPEDMKQARLIKEERKRIIAEAQAEADEIINNAKIKTEKMIDEHEITRAAKDKANAILVPRLEEAYLAVADFPRGTLGAGVIYST